jgi:hypothetical protein
MKRFLTLIIALLSVYAAHSQRIERQLIGSAGRTFSAGGQFISFSVGETVIKPSPSPVFSQVFWPMLVTIGFQQPHVATSGEMLHAAHWISAYPNPTTGHVRLDIHGDIGQNNGVRVFNMLGQEVALQPFRLVNGSVDLDFTNLAVGVYLVTVTDPVSGNNVSIKITRQLQ